MLKQLTKCSLRKSLTWHTKPETKCLRQKTLSLHYSLLSSVPCLITVSTTASFQKPKGSNACDKTSVRGSNANLRPVATRSIAEGMITPGQCFAPGEAGAEQRVKNHVLCNHKVSARGGWEEAPTPAAIKTLEKPLHCCPFHPAPDLSLTFCRRQTSLKIRPF